LSHGVWVLLTAAAVVYAIAFVGVAIYEVLSWSLDKGNAEFTQACGRCHSPMTPHHYAMAPSEWRKTVDSMLDRDGGAAHGDSPARRQRLAEFLIRRRSADGRTLFAWRCGRCHARSALTPYLALDERALRMLLQQHIAQNNFAIQKWEGDLVVGYVLAQSRPRPSATGADAAQRQVDFQAFCGLCHNVSFLYRRMCLPPKSRADWETVAERMRNKAPDAAGADNTGAFVQRSLEICAAKHPPT
jgi:hypothetical protein